MCTIPLVSSPLPQAAHASINLGHCTSNELWKHCVWQGRTAEAAGTCDTAAAHKRGYSLAISKPRRGRVRAVRRRIQRARVHCRQRRIKYQPARPASHHTQHSGTPRRPAAPGGRVRRLRRAQRQRRQRGATARRRRRAPRRQWRPRAAGSRRPWRRAWGFGGTGSPRPRCGTRTTLPASAPGRPRTQTCSCCACTRRPARGAARAARPTGSARAAALARPCNARPTRKAVQAALPVACTGAGSYGACAALGSTRESPRERAKSPKPK